MRIFSYGLALAMLLGSVAQAATETGEIYTCTFDATEANLLSPKVTLFHRDRDGKVEVADSLIMYMHGSPVEATVGRDDDKVLDVSWTNRLKDANQKSAQVVFQLIYRKTTHRATQRARAIGFLDSWSAKGTCTVRRGTY